jgi:RNA polymerase sigma-70 factor (ECF subfamily)
MELRTASGRPPAPASLTDLELVEQYKATRDPVFLGDLFERYAHLVLGVCLRYLRNREDAEDAVMEVYEHLTTALVRHEVANFKSWLHSVAANHCRMALRRRKSAPVGVEASEELLDAVLASAPAPHEADGAEEELEALRGALGRLGEGQRRCLELFYLEGHSYAEVARRSGYALNEVKSHIQNGKRSLRILLTARADPD